MGHANGRIWSPVSWYDAGHTIGIISQDEGTICRSSQVNPLSKWKPVADSQTRMGIMTLARMKSDEIGFGFFSYQGSGSYGSIYDQSITNVLDRALATKADTTKNGAWWGHFYSRPRGLPTYNEPYRCLDFADFYSSDGYNHKAISPFSARDVSSTSLQAITCQLARYSGAEIFPEDFDTVSQGGGKTAWRYGIVYRRSQDLLGEAMLALGPTLAQQEASAQPGYIDINLDLSTSGNGDYDCLWVVTKETNPNNLIQAGTMMLCDGLFKVSAGWEALHQPYRLTWASGTPGYRIQNGIYYLLLSSRFMNNAFTSIVASTPGAPFEYVATVFGYAGGDWHPIIDFTANFGHSIPNTAYTFTGIELDDSAGLEMGDLSEYTQLKLLVEARTTGRSSSSNAVTLVTDYPLETILTQQPS